MLELVVVANGTARQRRVDKVGKRDRRPPSGERRATVLDDGSHPAYDRVDL